MYIQQSHRDNADIRYRSTLVAAYVVATTDAI